MRDTAIRCWLLITAAVVSCKGECPARPPSDEYLCPVDVDDFIFPCLENGSPVIGQGRSCTPLAGMTLTIVCTDESLVLYSQNVSSRSFSIHYPHVNSSHAGLYECRSEDANNNRSHVMSSRIVEVGVPDTPIIGLQCKYQDFVNLKNGSLVCGVDNVDNLGGLPVRFNLYCVNCSVILDTEWAYHIGVDLDLQLSRESEESTVYTIGMGPNAQVPYAVGSYQNSGNPRPTVTILVTAISSRGLRTVSGFKKTFYNRAGLYAKLIPPPNGTHISIGNSAVFQCEFSYNANQANQASVLIELILANGTTYAGTCNSSSCSGRLSLDYASRRDNAAIVQISVLTLRSLTEEYNNSQVTCSLWFARAIQWKNTTCLTIFSSQSAVTDATLLSMHDAPLSSDTRCPQYCKAVVAGSVSGAAIVLGFGFVFIILLVLYVKRNKPEILPVTMNLQNMEKDDVVTDQYTAHDSTATQPFINTTISVNSNVTPSTCKSLTSLVFSNRRAKSMQEIGMKDKFNFENRTFYISCSEEKSSWVLTHLKPLVQKLIVSSEVIVANDRMLAGHPISEERMRLILKADQMLVVCSPGYERSPWCQYELIQSVSKDPSMIKGRIVTILCDGCRTPPLIISEVASIRDDDSMFESKLQKCLTKSIVKPMIVDH